MSWMSIAIAAAVSAPVPQIVAQGPATIANAHQFELRSETAARNFLVQVAAPVRALKAGERAAVIYVLDGDYMFGMAADVARNLQIVREVAPVYVVAIGYPGDSHGDWVTGRLRDMLDDEREVRGFKAGGGGAAFRRFLLEEVRPFVEARFPIDPGRTFLHGHSLGGLFAAAMLTQQPGAFAGYAIGSPSIWVRPEMLRNIRSAPGKAPRIYVGVGAEERDEDMVGWAARLTTELRSKNYPVEQRTFAGEGHVSVEGVLFANALKHLVPPAAE